MNGDALPLAMFVAFAAITMGWKSWHQKKKHGAPGMMLFKRDVRQKLLDASTLSVGVLIFIEAVVVAMDPTPLKPLRIHPMATTDIVAFSGVAIVVVATVLMVMAQVGLGSSWRIGIEEDARPGLVTSGFYQFCRNPIFFFLLLAIFGFVLMIPTWISVALLVLGYVGLSVQIRGEEAWLTRAYGDAYRAYARKVGRFVPWIGRL